MIKYLKNKKSSQSGSAIMLALTVFTIMSFLMVQITKETLVEIQISSQGVKQIQAEYAAKAGIEFALYRVLTYQQTVFFIESLRKTIGDDLADKYIRESGMLLLDFPISWPFATAQDADSFQKDDTEEANKESLFSQKVTIFPTISKESGKLDLNALGSPSQGLADSIRKQLDQLFLNQLQSNDEFEENNTQEDITIVLNNIQDWVDSDDISLNGGNENSLYPEDEYPITGVLKYPPNMAFKNIEELKLIPGMNEEIYSLLSANVTMFGSMGINVNTAPKEILKTLSLVITDEDWDEVIKVREDLPPPQGQGGPFNILSLQTFIESLGYDWQEFNPDKIALYFEELITFKIESIGEVGNRNVVIEANVLDFEKIQETLTQSLIANYKEVTTTSTNSNNNGTTNNSNSNNNTTSTPAPPAPPKKAPQGRPKVVNYQFITN